MRAAGDDEAARPRPGLPAAPLRSSTARLSDQVARELEQQILIGEIPPGELLPTEAELGAAFGVSRSVVRDAVRTLSARDLTETRAGVGNRVLPPNDYSLSRAMLGRLARSSLTLGEVMRARAQLEQQIVPLAASRSTPAQREEVAAAFADLESAVAQGRWDDAHRADWAFHVALLEAAGGPALDLILVPMRLVIYVCAGAPVADRVEAWNVAGHQAIVAALLEGDETALRAAIQDHFSYLDWGQYADYTEQQFRDLPKVRSLIAGDELGLY